MRCKKNGEKRKDQSGSGKTCFESDAGPEYADDKTDKDARRFGPDPSTGSQETGQEELKNRLLSVAVG